MRSKTLKPLDFKKKQLKKDYYCIRNNSQDWQIGSHKLKSFHSARETIKTDKRQATEQEKIIDSYKSERTLISRIYEELQKLDTNRKKRIPNKIKHL